MYINYKLNIHPYDFNTIKIVLLISLIYLIFNYITFKFSPIVDIALKSVLISITYISLVYFLKLSETINRTIISIIK